jgi:solute carrier family 25 (mitochondrial oxoglutarate transporter), member 11
MSKEPAPVQKATAPSGARQIKNYVRGGFSGMFATCCIQPLDIIKVRIQLRSEAVGEGLSLSPVQVAKDLYKEGGVRNYYTGLDSALLRQATYTTLRFGFYFNLTDYMKMKKEPGANLSFLEKSLISLTAGGCASLFGTPFDLILVRMQSDGMLPVEQRRNYKNVIDACRRVPKEEGFLNLWKGATPTVIRAMAINFGMLGPYDECKERLAKYFGYTKKNYIISCAIAGFLAAFVSLPFDNVKTKLQKQKAGPDGKFQYKGVLDCMGKTLTREGFHRFWAGFPTFYIRIAPHAMISLLITDILRRWMNM